MWIKYRSLRHNLNTVKRYSYDYDIPDDKIAYLKYPDETCNLYFENITGVMFCEYLDHLIISGEDKNITIMEINKELEEKIETFFLQFPTIEEFKK